MLDKGCVNMRYIDTINKDIKAYYEILSKCK